ncbi:MAG TPA: type II toxin-antitoxin system PemK/MazF family toxin [Sphingomonadales bacterium]
MAIKYAVAPGTVLICDYRQFKPPEMTKERPAIVVSPRLPHRDGLCAVVPLSQSPNNRPAAWDVRVELSEPTPPPYPGKVFWAKCDMLFTAGFHRLRFFKGERDQYGKRKYVVPKVDDETLFRIRKGVMAAIGGLDFKG